MQGWTQQADVENLAGSGKVNYKMITDRSLYIVGEDINFRVFNQAPESMKKMKWSSVLYMELISPQGYSNVRAKYALDSLGVSGAISIPEHLPSGLYYLKAYTRWMRNSGPEAYCYLSVELVNPYSRSLVPVDTISSFSPIRFCHTANHSSELAVSDSLKGPLETRAQVYLNLMRDISELPVDCSVSVIRKGMVKAQWESVDHSGEISREIGNHLPETRGVSLTGKVEFSESGLPAPYAVVYISQMSNGREFYCNFTDTNGRFHFAFPGQYGESELFISASNHTRDALKILIDQDFCKEALLLPSYPLKLDDGDLELIREMSDNVQIAVQFDNSTNPPGDTGSTIRTFFYGDPTSIILFDDFIKLPTMEEYFSEVTPQVALRRSREGARLQVLGDHPDLDIFPPLVMIDGVAVGKVESVLAISPRLIKQMEVVEAPYIRGNVTFGGIINIISRNDDLGFIDLPESGILAHYKMFNANSPGIPDNLPLDERFPDLRNTLYWNPHLELIPGKSTMIHFSTADTKGEYEVVLRGYDSMGNFVEEHIPFEVGSLQLVGGLCVNDAVFRHSDH